MSKMDLNSAAQTAPEASFPQFSRLPIELRQQIWEAATPEQDLPAVFFFSWRWSPSFRNNMGGADRLVQLPMPATMWVCREARNTLMKQFQNKGYEIQFREETKGHILVRRYEPGYDYLYVTPLAWDEEFSALFPMIARLSSVDPVLGEMCEAVQELALPASIVYNDLERLGSMLGGLKNLKTIYVMWNELPSFRYAHDRSGFAAIQPRWELKELEMEKDVEVRMAMEREEAEENGQELIECGNLDNWMDDLYMQLSTLELEEGTYDEETGEISMNFVPVEAYLV
ncbi:hypothetical protein PT974_02652 [Cladobotryum mycophilum]|uniref:2EXR domain-containing protein n=1 Tax=Cladobotryum mycophilum TaxID=491253 RepID=A0ABR0SYW7_9HYPO